MSFRFRSLVLVALINALLAPAGARAAPAPRDANPSAPDSPAAPAANAWYDGQIQYSTITNCFSIIQGVPYQEYGAGAYTGFRADPDAGQPSPNTTYYVHVVVGGLGNSCSGQRAYLDLALPASTSLAIDASNRVKCYYDGIPIAPASDCPQSLPSSPYNPGAYAIPSTDAARAYTWPIPQGHTLEFQIPVKSVSALSNSALVANVWMLDGNSSPWLHPQQGVYVFSNQPTILYPSPSTMTATTTSAHSEAYLYAFGAGGMGHFQLGTTTGYGLIDDAVVIPSSGTAWLVWDEWGPPALQPDTLYHWRFTFTTGAQTYYGADQTFRTLPDGRVTIGQGQASGCTESAFNSALATAKEILFDCGALPITITVSGAHSIASNITIDGGNKVTLASNGGGNHFNVQAPWRLTLTRITLSGGVNTWDCGGAINVNANAYLTLNETRLVGNSSDYQGGALCNWGSANISATLFASNTAPYSHGGAIGNFGTARIVNSRFAYNTAYLNGGGIDMGGSVAVTNSVFTRNTGLRGGGINTYYGNLTVAGSSFISNTATYYGGGLSNDASFTTVSGSTFSDNYATNYGGGLENTGSLTLTGSTVSANRAGDDGGGLYEFSDAAPGPITVLNTTIVNNVAMTQGGNIYMGGVGGFNGFITLKNTIVGAGSPNNCSGSVQSYGNNLESANSCGLGGGSQFNVDPKIGPLQNNGGSTLTRAPLPGSPAIDAGANLGCPAIDQRGVARPIDGNSDGSVVCDIGAVEALPPRSFLPALRR